MIKNNIKIGMKVKYIESVIIWAQLSEKIGISGQYVNHIIKKEYGIMNKIFV